MKKLVPLVTGAAVLAVSASIATASPGTTTMGQKNIVQTAVAAGQFKTLASLLTKEGLAATLEGKALSIRVSGGKVIVGGATVIKPNVTACNGVMHVINKVLLPS
jgi:uncharacterized surface protein with fasciclin (FAS1) repeats